MEPAVANHTPRTERLMRLATMFSMIAASVLIVIKGIAWGMSDSLSLLASLFDSLFDLLASAINFMAVRYALMPPDDEHRFGHGKAEDVAALAQSTFIAGSGVMICVEGIKRLFSAEPVEHNAVAIGVMVISLLITLALVAFQRYVVRQTGSIVVKSDSLHYLTDVLSNSAVLVALVLTSLGFTLADPVFALLIAGYIFKGAWDIGYGAFHNLLDREFTDEERNLVMETAKAHPAVLEVHELKTRRSGIYAFIQIHLVFPADISLKDSHQAADDVEAELKKLFVNSEVMIHQDPYGVE